jgi:hypothetical protein
MKILLALAIVVFSPAPSVAGQPEAPSTIDAGLRVELTDLGWLSGCWEGRAFGQAASECWMPAPSGRLTGMFQLLNGADQQFSEIFVIDRFDDGPALRLKHFDPNLIGWEEKDGFVRFPLLETGPDFARFDGLLYRRQPDGTLLIELRMKRDGETVIESMQFRRSR